MSLIDKLRAVPSKWKVVALAVLSYVAGAAGVPRPIVAAAGQVVCQVIDCGSGTP